MKKTLIALAVAASAAVSGSAMAWTANGTGGSVDMGGTLNPVDKVTPWEVKTGAAVTGLDADIRKGDKKVDIPVKNAIPVLGIRNFDVAGFSGQTNVDPQISYSGAVDIDGFTGGVTTVTLELKDASNMKIGTLSAPFSAVGVASWKNISNPGRSGGFNIFSNNAGTAFWGGIGKNVGAIVTNQDSALSLLNSLDSEFTGKFTNFNRNWVNQEHSFSNLDTTYVSAYGSGIEAGKNITITLDSPAQGDDSIVWKASLPVTVSYE